MIMKYEQSFREAHPETVGETDTEYDLINYAEYLESRVALLEAENTEYRAEKEGK
jgi:hypothetical protein